MLRRHFHTKHNLNVPGKLPVGKEPSCCQTSREVSEKEKSEFFVASSQRSVGRTRTPKSPKHVTSPGVQQTRKRAKSPELLGECFTSFYCFSLFIFIIAMEKYNLITLYKRLDSLKFKQAKMVSDLFPNQVQRETKSERLHQQLRPLLRPLPSR